MEALRRSKFKFPGRQYIVVSNKWGFTPIQRDEYEKMRAEGKIQPDGVHCKVINEHGPLTDWIARLSIGA